MSDLVVVCDKCGGGTVPKQITSKKTGKQYTLYECTSGCMNGKFPYSCFPPKAGIAKAQPPVQDTFKAEVLALLNEIKDISLNIQRMSGKKDAEETPF